MANIHLVIQGKGGVGKSLLAFYIAQYVREKNGKCLVFDTDPLNQTLSRSVALEAKIVRILADDHITIIKNAFDLMIEECEAEDADVVIDVGASSFVHMLEYCAKNGVYDLWHAMGHSCILHSIITGKDFRDTCKMFGVVMEKTGRLSSVSSLMRSRRSFSVSSRSGDLIFFVGIFAWDFFGIEDGCREAWTDETASFALPTVSVTCLST